MTEKKIEKSQEENAELEAEQMLKEISNMLGQLNNEATVSQFDTMEFQKKMRRLKVYLSGSMERKGLSLKDGSGGDMRWHPMFKEMALNLYQSIVMASAQGNYELQFNATVELHDLLRSVKDVGVTNAQRT